MRFLRRDDQCVTEPAPPRGTINPFVSYFCPECRAESTGWRTTAIGGRYGRSCSVCRTEVFEPREIVIDPVKWAAQLWCRPENEKRQMDPELVESIANALRELLEEIGVQIRDDPPSGYS